MDSTNTCTEEVGFLRLCQILAPNGPIPVSKSSWWQRVRTGEYPSPVKLGPRTSAWRRRDIADLIRRLEGEVKTDG
ncbi:hypothetical protein CTT39_08455 [Agrobacterium rosae]|nr:hypothetical protein CTT39_08455 [Agrobacterium rosae]